MSTTEKARKLMAQERQHEEHLQENMLSRAVQEVPKSEETAEKARELLTQERKEDSQLQENMLSRAIEETRG